ncbi:hypothetical protein [Thalassobacillus sp. CUG 92003]|uniref:hypothetical protein n=1 Tax=Thalassobacillus sp. CUG 92003 TaxID=2736641 RepID=UPI0015E7913E|nr:hypothetical protein [Thalassobacillus sp. CUG 92003]
MRIFYWSRRKLLVAFGTLLIGIAAFFIWGGGGDKPVTTFSETAKPGDRVINLVTGEFKAKTADGKEIEAYRWDPGTIFVEKDEPFTLSIFGVNGKEHPFVIEGTDVKGVVKQGEETLIDLKFKKEGIYRLICTTHANIESNGPMIAYIVVD